MRSACNLWILFAAELSGAAFLASLIRFMISAFSFSTSSFLSSSSVLCAAVKYRHRKNVNDAWVFSSYPPCSRIWW